MALNCSISLNTNAYAAGQNPPPQATLTVYNPNAVAVVVSSVQVTANQLGNTSLTLPIAPITVATGPGITTTVPALGSINLGPFPIVLASAAYAGSANPAFFSPPGTSNPTNPQGSQPPSYVAQIGALVYGSDGSVNQASYAGVTVSQMFNAPLGTAGGFLNFAGPQNAANFLMGLI